VLEIGWAFAWRTLIAAERGEEAGKHGWNVEPVLVS
jgi:hypothetical protein